MKLWNLQPAEGSRTSRRRVGRGTGSGLGKTSGKGHKGQKARSGGKIRPGFEGGQMPIARRLPKRGFKNPFRKEYWVVNVGDLNRLDVTEPVTPEVLKAHGFIRNLSQDVKLLAKGDLEKAFTIRVHKASEAAVAKVEKAGGKVEVL